MHRKSISLKNTGFTIVELLIVIILLSLLFFMMTPVFFFPKKTNNIMKRLDIYHKSRQINHSINLRIKLAYDVNFPPNHSIGKKEWFHQIVFRNYLQQTIIICLNDNHELVEINYDKITDDKLSRWKSLGKNVDSFKVRRPSSNVIELKITYLLPNKKTYTVSTYINLINII